MLHFSDFCELVRNWLFKMTSKHSAQVLSVALKCWGGCAVAYRGNSGCWGAFIEKAQEGPVGHEFSVNQSTIYIK